MVAAVLLSFVTGCADSERRSWTSDFNDGTAGGWSPHEGAWSVQDGQYVGTGTGTSACSPVATTLLEGAIASDVEVSVDMTSLNGVDKLVVLRSLGDGERIELNVRAERPSSFPADLVASEVHGCQQVLLWPEFDVLAPHQVGQQVRIKARLVGDHLSVWMNDLLLVERDVPFQVKASGAVGLAVGAGGMAAFDNVAVEVLAK